MSRPASKASSAPAPTVVRTPKAPRARRLVSEVEIHIGKLFSTLQSYPTFDLASREEFLNLPEMKNLAGRTFKKAVSKREEADAKGKVAEPAVYLLKKNARELSDKSEGKQKTPSRKMDLEKNHAESFREICALRLFQLLWGDLAATPADAKIVLSDFDISKMQNAGKSDMTKVYVA